MLPTERISYSPISERPALKLPDGKRMAVWVIVNVEEWDANQPMPRTVLTPPAGGSPSPDIPNWAWHEYGNRRIPRDRQCREGTSLGIHGPRLYPAQHAEGRERARGHPQDRRRHCGG